MSLPEDFFFLNLQLTLQPLFDSNELENMRIVFFLQDLI